MSRTATHHTPQLTEKRLEILRKIRDLTAAGLPPSKRELGKSQGAVDAHLTALDRLGLIEWPYGVVRGLKVTPKGLAALGGDS